MNLVDLAKTAIDIIVSYSSNSLDEYLNTPQFFEAIDGYFSSNKQAKSIFDLIKINKLYGTDTKKADIRRLHFIIYKKLSSDTQFYLLVKDEVEYRVSDQIRPFTVSATPVPNTITDKPRKSDPSSENSASNEVILAPSNLVTKKKDIRRENSDAVKVFVASPSDVHPNRIEFMMILEATFRTGGYESLTNRRLIVSGWEYLPSGPGYPQDNINKELAGSKFVVAIFKHKIGNPTIDRTTGEKRARSGTVEELQLSLENHKKNKQIPLLYFFNEAPTTSADHPEAESIVQNWKELKEFKQSMNNEILHKSFGNIQELIRMILDDIAKHLLES